MVDEVREKERTKGRWRERKWGNGRRYLALGEGSCYTPRSKEEERKKKEKEQ